MFKTLVIRPLKVWEFGNTYLGTTKGDTFSLVIAVYEVYECSISKGTSSLMEMFYLFIVQNAENCRSLTKQN